jgi:hypothetical protein
MRSYDVIAIAALVAGLGVTLVFSSRPMAEANIDAVKGFHMDVSKMHGNAGLAEEKTLDMTFVFTHGE